MEIESGVIVRMEHVDKKNESPNLEHKALRRGLDFLACTSVIVGELITDASISIIAMSILKPPV